MTLKTLFRVAASTAGAMSLNPRDRPSCCVSVFAYFARCWCRYLASRKVMSSGDDVGSV